jgi:hypothetical protein
MLLISFSTLWMLIQGLISNHSLTPSRELCSSVTDPKELLWDLYKLYRNEDVTHAVTLTLWFTLNRVVHVHRFELDNIHFSDIFGFVSMPNINVQDL